MARLRSLLLACTLALGSATAVAGSPGCYGKMWNPLTDINFTLMGGIKAFDMKLTKDPTAVDTPPYAEPKKECACNAGAGVGLGFWMPSYLKDVSRRGTGCLGFLNGVEVLKSFSSLSSGQETAFNAPGKEGVTSMQVHWAYADITAIAGKQVFERCGKIQSEFSIGYLTEVDFTWQNDVYAAIMTPEVALLGAVPVLSQFACGAEAIANTLGSFQNIGISAWEGCRFPLSGSTIGANSAQVVNMNVAIKYLARASRLGIMLRTTGEDAMCEPKISLTYDPFQHRFDWAYPNKAATRFNQHVLLWGMGKKSGRNDSMMSLTDDASKIASANAMEAPPPPSAAGTANTSKAPTSGQLSLAESIVGKVPKGLNYPSREAGWMTVWEYRQCCLVLITVETVVKWVIDLVGGNAKSGTMVADLYKYYKVANYAYTAGSIIAQAATDPLGALISTAGAAIEYGVSAAASQISTGMKNSFNKLTT